MQKKFYQVSSIGLKFFGDQIVKGRVAIGSTEKRISHELVRSLGEVGSIPVDVLCRLIARGGSGEGAARVEDVEVVGPAAVAAAGLVPLLEPVFWRVLQQHEVRVVVVRVEDD